MSAHPIPAAALAHHIAVVGKTGSGKTFAAKGAVEGLLARGERTLVIDPTGVWWGLRLQANGKRASPHVPVIFGGRHGDLPLADKNASEAGARLAAALGGSATPAILDLQQMSVATRTRLATALFEGLLRENRGPLTLVLDEAHLFAPQSGGAGGNFETTALLHATNNLVALGRSAGLRIMMITQRPAKLHKDSLSQVECMVALRLVDPRDRKAVKEWLDGAPDPSRGAEIMASLASLPTGTGWIYAPELGVLEQAAFPAIATFDAGRPLEAGEIPELKPIDVGALRESMTVEAASDAASAGNKRQGRGSSVAPARPSSKVSAAIERPASAAEIAEAERRGEARGFEKGREAGWHAAAAEAKRLLATMAASASAAAPAHPASLAKTPPAPRPTPRAPAPVGARVTGSDPTTNGKVGAERRILAVLASASPAGMTEAQWAVAAGMKRTGGTWGTYKGRLRRAGAIEHRGELWFATTQGLDMSGTAIAPMPAAGPDLVEFWISRIASVGPMLRTLAKHYPHALLRSELADEIGMAASGGSFNTYLSRLRSAGLIEQNGSEIRAAVALMGAPAAPASTSDTVRAADAPRALYTTGTTP